MIAFTRGKTSKSTRVILDSLAFPVAVVDRQGKILYFNKWWKDPVWRSGIFATSKSRSAVTTWKRAVGGCRGYSRG